MEMCACRDVSSSRSLSYASLRYWTNFASRSFMPAMQLLSLVASNEAEVSGYPVAIWQNGNEFDPAVGGETSRVDRQASGQEGSRSISELLQQLTEQTTRLAQKEIELAKAEMAVKGRRLGMGAGAFSGAGLLALFGLGAATAGAGGAGRGGRRGRGAGPSSGPGLPALSARGPATAAAILGLATAVEGWLA